METTTFTDHALATDTNDVSAEPTSSRRDAFKKLAVGAVGAMAAGGVIAGLTAEPAAAVDGGNIIIGDAVQTAQSETALHYSSGPDAHAGVFFAIEGTGLPTSSAAKSALNGWVFGATAGSTVVNGVYGFTTKSTGYGVVARSTGGSGLLAQGDHVNVHFVPAGTPAPSRLVDHSIGDFVVDVDGDLWYCVTAGNPGTWRKLSGATTAGALHVLPEPLRAFDSRSGAPLAAGSTTIIGLLTGKNGANANAFAVPNNASAALVNITLTATTGYFGFIQAYSASLSAPPATSVMNWSTPDDNVANEVTVKVDNFARMKVTIGVNATHLVADVVGYYQ